MTPHIGILFWGCKGGHRNFCDNGVIDVYSTEIRQTYKDVRSFVTFSVVNTDFYALEFTKDYKVYTLYRSSNDSGSGAFIALTIYVPHSLLVTGIRTIMEKMMDEYFAQYFNPITNSPIPGMIDDITPFEQMFQTYAQSHTIPDTTRYYKRPSRQDDTPRILAYSSLEEVDAYFACPYHPEFFDCQEVMFISSEILKNQSDYGLRFLVQPILIQHVSDPEPEPYINLFPASHDFRLTQFKVNGVDHTASQGDVPLYAGDRISMRIEGSWVQRPIVLDNVALEEILQKGLIRKNGNAYQFLPVYNLDYEDFNVLAHIEGDDSGMCYRCYALRSLNDSSVLVPGAQYDPRSGRFVFSVNGKYLDHRFQLIYSVLPNFSIPTLIVELNKVDVSMLINQRHTLELMVQNHVENLVYPEGKPRSLNFKITSSDKTRSISGAITDPGSRVELYLPKDFEYTSDDVKFSSSDYNVRLDQRGRFEVYPKEVNVEVVLPRHLENFDLTGLIPSYVIDGKTYKGYWEQQKCYIKLPYQWTDQRGELFIGGHKFPFEELSRTRITFKCAVVNNRTNKNVGFNVIFEDNSKTTQKLHPGMIDIYPSNVDIRISSDFQSQAVVEEKGFASDNKTKIFVLVPRHLESSSSSYGLASGSGSGSNNQSSSGTSDGFDFDDQDYGNSQDQDSSETQSLTRRPDGEFTHPRETKAARGSQRNPSKRQSGSTVTIDGGNESTAASKRSGRKGNQTPGCNTQDSNNDSNNTEWDNNAGNKADYGFVNDSFGHSQGHNQGHNHTGTYRDSDNGEPEHKRVPPLYLVKLINCETLNARVLQSDNTYKLVPIDNLETTNYIKVNPAVGQLKLLNSREKEVCVVNFPQSEYLRDKFMAERNAKNGFEVNWVDDNRCMVHYNKNTFFSKVIKSFIANKKLYGGVISILIIALITACWIFFVRNSEDYSLDLRFGVDKSSVTTEAISAVGFKNILYSGDSLIVSNNGDILNCKAEENPLKTPSAGGEFFDLYVVYSSGDIIRLVKDNAIRNLALDSTYLVIYPDEILVSQVPTEASKSGKTSAAGPKGSGKVAAKEGNKESAKDSSKTGSKETDKEWNIEMVLDLLANTKEIDRNLILNVQLPPLSYLQAYKEISAMPEVEDKLIDSLINVYPQYKERTIRLKETSPAQGEESASDETPETSEGASDSESESATAGNGDNPATAPGKEVKTPGTTPGTGSAPGAVTTPSTGSAPGTDAAKNVSSETDPNAAIKKEYESKIAQLDGAFTKETVDDIIQFRNNNSSKIGKELIKKYKSKLNAYYNFVMGGDFDISQMTPEQQKAINFVKEFHPDLYKARFFPAIYNKYSEAGGK